MVAVAWLLEQQRAILTGSSIFSGDIMRKRTFITATLIAGTSLSGLAQDAAAYPNKPIRMIVNFPPGGTVDVLTRTVAQKLSERFGHPVVVENRAGAGGNIGAQLVAAAGADGYTLLATPPGPMTINQNLYKDLQFDPARLVPVVMLAGVSSFSVQ